ncbi:hypothetical protein HPB47_004765 [Ixodes persulcatus]|uniref:Uncharacterized protein n=1 Tax=Ixodes persulcatus TaxID=34615 RepID=A0AC60PES0_IXOPE|nr:hypothetical protein HPB47_004765 [Ixodes persulcatus]
MGRPVDAPSTCKFLMDARQSAWTAVLSVGTTAAQEGIPGIPRRPARPGRRMKAPPVLFLIGAVLLRGGSAARRPSAGYGGADEFLNQVGGGTTAAPHDYGNGRDYTTGDLPAPHPGGHDAYSNGDDGYGKNGHGGPSTTGPAGPFGATGTTGPAHPHHGTGATGSPFGHTGPADATGTTGYPGFGHTGTTGHGGHHAGTTGHTGHHGGTTGPTAHGGTIFHTGHHGGTTSPTGHGGTTFHTGHHGGATGHTGPGGQFEPFRATGGPAGHSDHLRPGPAYVPGEPGGPGYGPSGPSEPFQGPPGPSGPSFGPAGGPGTTFGPGGDHTGPTGPASGPFGVTGPRTPFPTFPSTRPAGHAGTPTAGGPGTFGFTGQPAGPSHHGGPGGPGGPADLGLPETSQPPSGPGFSHGAPHGGQQQGGDYDDGQYHGDDGQVWPAIRGTPGQDYPIYNTVPQTGFSCKNHQYPGYYGDTEAQCQVFHICQEDGRHDAFLCPNGTVFNQRFFVCDWWYNFDCNETPQFYDLNSQLYVVPEGGFQGGPSGGQSELTTLDTPRTDTPEAPLLVALSRESPGVDSLRINHPLLAGSVDQPTADQLMAALDIPNRGTTAADTPTADPPTAASDTAVQVTAEMPTATITETLGDRATVADREVEDRRAALVRHLPITRLERAWMATTT